MFLSLCFLIIDLVVKNYYVRLEIKCVLIATEAADVLVCLSF